MVEKRPRSSFRAPETERHLEADVEVSTVFKMASALMSLRKPGKITEAKDRLQQELHVESLADELAAYANNESDGKVRGVVDAISMKNESLGFELRQRILAARVKPGEQIPLSFEIERDVFVARHQPHEQMSLFGIKWV